MPQHKKIVTRQGEMWDQISVRVYGSEVHTAMLIEANHAHRYTSIFSAGVELQAPALPAGAQAQPNLPPWMRGGQG